jgi:hypothetical protein
MPKEQLALSATPIDACARQSHVVATDDTALKVVKPSMIPREGPSLQQPQAF